MSEQYFDDGFDFDDFDSEFRMTRYLLRIFQRRLMKGIIWYVKNGPFDFQNLYQIANRMGLEKWKMAAQAGTTGSGAILTFVPVIGLPFDVTALLDGMMRTSYGIGAVIAKENNLSWTVLDRSDFLDVLAIWAGVDDFVGNEAAKESLMNNRIGNRVFGKVGSKTAAKVAAKAATKIAIKFSAKLGAKVASIIPFAGPAANGGINLWYITEITGAAEKYYREKFTSSGIA